MKLMTQLIKPFSFSAFFVLWGCDLGTDTNPVNAPNNSQANDAPSAIIVGDTTASIGDTVQLDGAYSSDNNDDSLRYQWSVVERPASPSAPAISDSADSLFLLSFDSLGMYRVRLIVSDGMLQDTAMVTISVGVEILGSITADRTLVDLFEDTAQADYYVTSDISISAMLTVEAGVRIEISKNRTIHIDRNGVLISQGTAGDSVIFTSRDIAGGEVWGGLLYSSSDTRNVLSYTKVTHAGGADMFWLYEGYNSNVAANVALDDDARLSVWHSRISHGAAFGILLNETASLDSFQVNRLYGNTYADIFIPAKELTKISTNTVYDDSTEPPMFFGEDIENDTGYIDSSIDLSDHIRKVVRVYNSSVPAGETHVWSRLGSNGTYYFSGNVTINGMVTVSGDAVFETAEDKFISVGINGVFIADGGPNQPITFTSAGREGDITWGGLYFASSDSRNLLEYTRVEYGGGDNAFWLYNGYNTNVAANISLEDDARLAVTNSYVGMSDAIGLVADDQASLTSFAYNVFESNGTEPLVINAGTMAAIDSMTHFENNGTDAVRIYRSSVSQSSAVRWVSLYNDVPWLFSGKVTASAPLTIAAGAQLHFRDDIQLDVSLTGSINAVGTAMDSIVFTSANEAGGTRWAGIRIASNDAANSMEFVRVSYGGDGDSPFWLYGAYNQDGQTNIGLDESAQLSLTNSTISHSGKFGITINEGAQINGLDHSVTDGPAQVAAQNTFQDNGADDVAFE
ncbi:MAG: hypothetical protein GF398_02240 [Chitinivibrionales bacterium]|nr:hypothetical protein [Chitinivibrionales bacterium]